ncbi:diguanylate cyclase (GGDEF)-like protein [Motilibacter rhizosphaerae]|uniref:Diguanylate cyclase (GGDEF)-like protein n=1 Tax=Motilibacter rhizosphaerae TaxID=598652 RepID=A0A4Q7NVR3_9ACTN|nr:EAL domain-containing protein [Motilibacter rhizosphaerae]RZS90968.1 diguanylate cyclase (GGDEF)-like protein [Motilibacter rhizosphaerae]
MGRRPTVAFFTPLVAGPFFGVILRGLQRECAARGARLLAVQTLHPAVGDEFKDFPDVPGGLSSDRYDAVVSLTFALDDEHLAAVRATGKPVVMVSREVAGFPSVLADNTTGGREVVEHLLRHGHRRIAWVGSLENQDTRERHAAYEQVLREHGIEPDPRLRYEVDNLMDWGGEAAGRALLADGLPATAVVCANDNTAIGLSRALQEAGLRLPLEMAVVGFDDTARAGAQSPALASVGQPFERLGELAARLALAGLEGPLEPVTHRVPTSYVPRASCGCDGLALVGRGGSVGLAFADRLAALFPEVAPGSPAHAELGSAGTALTTALAVASEGAAPLEPAQVEQAVRHVFALRPRRETMTGLLREIQAELRDRGCPRDIADELVRELAMCLADARTSDAHEATRHLRDELRSEYDISMELLRAPHDDPSSLRWLARTRCRAGCVGLWSAPAEVGHTLHLVQSFGSLGTEARGLQRVEEFPPRTLLDLVDPEAGELAFVLPVRTATRDWGLLALVGKPELATATGRETYFQWSALLAVALEQRESQAERVRLEEQLRRRALFDELTGLPNRAYFNEQLQEAVGRAGDEPFAMLFLDLDGFKLVNDGLGHLAGDDLLTQVASRLLSCIRAGDVAARFGGDEFAVLLRDAEPEVVEAVVERLQAELARPYDVQGHPVVATAAIGIAHGAPAYTGAEQIVRDADIAMYAAKARERGSTAVFQVAMHDRAVDRLRLEGELRRAIEGSGDGSGIEVHYQPIVRLSTGRIAALEALVRWRNSAGRLVSPADFLPVAEETGLIVPLGQLVLRESWRQLLAWRAAGVADSDLSLSVNLSHREFWHRDLLDVLDAELALPGAVASRLSLEITEGVVMDNAAEAASLLGELHGRGVNLHIDDFGTGYSSLEALHSFPIDALKIDRSFVGRLHLARGREIIRAITAMGRSLGMEVIAEGIETPEQPLRLRALGCPMGQGYLFARPAPAAELAELLVTGIDTSSWAPGLRAAART